MRSEIKSRQLWIWIAAAMSAPLAHFGGCGWMAVLLAAVAVLPLTLLGREGWQEMGRAVRLAEFVWLAVMAGILLQSSCVYWPASNHEIVVPLTLLALTAAANVAAGPRTGPVIGLILVALYMPVLIASCGQVEYTWLEPKVGDWSGELLVALMLPALAGVWKRAPAGQGKALVRIGIMSALLSVITQGLLSWQVAAQLDAPFYEVARTVQIGTSTRLESLVTAAVTLGWYAMSSFMIGTAAQLVESAGIKARHGMLTASVIAAMSVLFQIDLAGIYMVSITLALWGIVPLMYRKKKCRK